MQRNCLNLKVLIDCEHTAVAHTARHVGAWSRAA